MVGAQGRSAPRHHRWPAPVGVGRAAEERARLRARARGRVLVVGPSPTTGSPPWPAAVDEVVTAPGFHDRLPDGPFDTVECAFALCAAPDPHAAAAELRAVLAGDGTLLYLEHVLGSGAVGHWQRAFGRAWSLQHHSCRPDRDTQAILRAAGFGITDRECFTAPWWAAPVHDLVAGVAVVRRWGPTAPAAPGGAAAGAAGAPEAVRTR